MIGGEIYFDDRYSENCLVNAMAVGFPDKGDPIARVSPPVSAMW